LAPAMTSTPAGIWSGPYTLTINNLQQPVNVTPSGYGLTFNPPSMLLTLVIIYMGYIILFIVFIFFYIIYVSFYFHFYLGLNYAGGT
jgi:hypothetical protein